MGIGPTNKESIFTSTASADPIFGRVLPIDAARGMAMLFSCLSHFGWEIEAVYPQVGSALIAVGMIATPTFLLLSGAMAGFVSGSKWNDIARVQNTLINRGIFILLVGHLAISLTEARHIEGIIRTLPNTFATDAIGLGSMLSAWLVARSLSWRLAAGAAFAFLCGWLIVIFWHPANYWLAGTKQLLVGSIDRDLRVVGYTSPFLQYISIYVIGLPFGRWLAGRLSQPGQILPTGKMMIQWGSIALASSLAFRIVVRVFSDQEFTGAEQHFLHLTMSIGQKLPPSPAYLLFYAGGGVALTGLVFVCWHHRVGTVVLKRLADVGRASLLVFVLQYFTLWTLPDMLGIQPGPSSAFVLCGNLVLLWLAARGWTAIKGNRWMTVGLRLGSAH